MGEKEELRRIMRIGLKMRWEKEKERERESGGREREKERDFYSLEAKPVNSFSSVALSLSPSH